MENKLDSEGDTLNMRVLEDCIKRIDENIEETAEKKTLSTNEIGKRKIDTGKIDSISKLREGINITNNSGTDNNRKFISKVDFEVSNPEIVASFKNAKNLTSTLFLLDRFLKPYRVYFFSKLKTIPENQPWILLVEIEVVLD